ncbi:hypothetical protein KL928_000013 [Ogataea angusta]|uniref:Uncharacterized protein n=1 Tax=Pichia angusta TaxID=870730 RepID=A0AAN6DKR4_PICAN|nr:uncharacterized protein KL928_000013 [Ogataea angusta]KAG7821538.1 hypothetical protein KL928_000013 [Ogataea angusta]
MRLLSAINNWLVLDESDNARNRDIVPIPVHRRRWKLDGFVSYWAISSIDCSWKPANLRFGSGEQYLRHQVPHWLFCVPARGFRSEGFCGRCARQIHSVGDVVCVPGVAGRPVRQHRAELVEPVVSEHDEHASRLRPDDDSGADWVHCIPANQRACAHGAPRILLTVPR